MNIKLLVSLILGALPLTMMAQDDDMYFVPTKKSAPKVTVRNPRPAPTFYSGSNRSVDEYNRRGVSHYEVLPTDTAASDIIAFDGQKGVYPDSTMMTDDYALTRQMSRWEGYDPEDFYVEGYRDGRRDSWTWHSPWFYSSYYPWYDSYWYWNAPWYYGWYDPWYYGHYGWYGGWYDPWYYDSYWYGGYYPYYGGGVVYHNGPAGTERHGRVSYSSPRGLSNGHSTTYSAGTFGGRSIGSGVRTGSFGSSRTTGTRSTTTTSTSRPASSGRVTNAYGNFGGSRSSNSSTYSSSSSSTRSYTPTYSGSSGGSVSSGSSGSSGSFGGGGSYGGSRSSGGGGGGRSGGFGGRR